ncbi:hypothetical protein PVAP13_4KG311700 [Panicum virgatum]|uniref:Uncharacterized protein n=1 Tax=Panicum virgatum TaxID=38727 RepID=A0A8T0TPU2_PANVG|nr:hypothetical protein PVAP13_4KG311700 [Panicum virgatum]
MCATARYPDPFPTPPLIRLAERHSIEHLTGADAHRLPPHSKRGEEDDDDSAPWRRHRQPRRPPPTTAHPRGRRRRSHRTPAPPGSRTPPTSPSTPPPTSVWRPTRTRASVSNSSTITRSARRKRLLIAQRRCKWQCSTRGGG